ncbi:MAG: TonB-dependent receptor [Blastocatellia bacterium]|nr:TonB-dependent receptor [Blastocatellia bacterium]
MRFIKSWLALSLLLSSTLVFAQSATATLSGSVVDQQDSVVNGVKITVQNDATSLKREVTSNDDGRFVVPVLPPGNYTLTALRDGFAPVKINNIVLNVNDERALRIQLRVGAVGESVTVEAGTVTVSTSPAVATVVDQNYISRLPLNGRTIQNLLALTPGVIAFTASSQANVGQISANGMRTTQNYLTIDGVSANLYVGTNNAGNSQSNGLVPGFSQLGTTSNLVSVDALQEFKVQTSSYAPEYGRTPGAQIQLTTRSGANQFRGSLSEYFRNEKLDANDWFANASGLARPPLRHNNFGGTFSGPIWFPKPIFGPVSVDERNRTFFFFSYEGTRIRLPQIQNTTVPSRNVRNTAHSSLQPYFSVIPMPTGPDNAGGLNAPFIATYSNPQEQDTTAIRIDHHITSKVTIFGRYSHSPQSNQQFFPTRSQVQFLDGNTRTLTFGVNATFTPTLTNEARFNWSRNYAENSSGFRSFNGTTPARVSLPNLTDKSQVTFTFAGGGGYALNPGSTGLRRQINVTDTLTWVKSNHMFKFGFDYRQSPSKQELADLQLSALFNTLAATQTGRAASVSLTVNNPRFTDYNWKNFGAFAQDTWRVKKRLTLDYGVRWDVNPPPDVTPERRLVIMDFVNPVRLAEPGAALYPTVWNAFAPRIGGAFQVFTKDGWQTVLRGGYGLFFDVGAGTTGSVSGNFFPFTAVKNGTNLQFPFDNTFMTPPVISTTPPYSQGAFLVQYDKDYVLPRVHQWNVAMEQGLGKDQTLSVTYVGNAGRRLLRPAIVSPLSRAYPIASPDFAASTGFNLNSNAPGRADSSDYHAMQVQFNRRAKNISTIVNYTWSHSIDTNSATANVLNTNFFRVDPRVDRADSAFDRRHVFSAAMTWSLPSLSRATNVVMNALTRDWSLDGIFQYQTSYPMDVMYQDATANNNLSLGFLRPDIVVGQPLWITSTGANGRVLNPAAFSIPTTTRQGTVLRNSIRVDSLWQPDIALSRTFGLGEKAKLSVKGEIFNFVNHPMFAQPNNLLAIKSAAGITPAGTFGQFTNMLNRTPATEGIVLSSIYAPGGPRSVQLSMKLSF